MPSKHNSESSYRQFGFRRDPATQEWRSLVEGAPAVICVLAPGWLVCGCAGWRVLVSRALGWRALVS